MVIEDAISVHVVDANKAPAALLAAGQLDTHGWASAGGAGSTYQQTGLAALMFSTHRPSLLTEIHS